MPGNTRTILLALALASVLLAGCAMRDALPRDWPAATTTDMRCEDFSGAYLDRAQSSSANGQGLSLSRWLGILRPEDEIVTAIEIAAASTGPLSVVVHRTDFQGEPLAPLQFGTEVTCAHGELRWPDAGKAARDSLFIGSAHHAWQFSKGADGSLVVRSSDTAVGTVLVVVPVAAAEVRWYRFRPIAPSSIEPCTPANPCAGRPPRA